MGIYHFRPNPVPQSIAYFLSIILIGLSLAVSEVWSLKFRARSGPSGRHPRALRKREIAYKAEIRRPIVHSRFWSRSNCVSRDSHRAYRTEINSLQSQLYSSESAWTCVGRCKFVSSRVEEGHLTFPSCVSFSEAICGVESILRRAMSKKRRLRSSASACSDVNNVAEESWKGRCRILSLSLPLGKPGVELLPFEFVVNVNRSQLELPKACL